MPFIWCSYKYKVNLINKLFSHHVRSSTTSSLLYQWAGQSGKEYQYQIYPIDAVLQALPGNYIYAVRTEDGHWVPIYISQTRDLHQRLEGHVGVSDAIQNGATHMHVHYASEGPAARCSEERDLVLRWQPVCNEPVET
jgi:hypothetical protein